MLFRRLSAFALILICSSQSMAVAAPTPSRSVGSIPVGEQLAAAVHPMFAALSQTWVFAVITGGSQRYAAEHAPAPVFPRLPGPNIRPDSSRTRTIDGIAVQGGLGHAGRTLPDVLPAQAPPDPLAMNSGGRAQSSARRVIRAMANTPVRTAATIPGFHLRAMTATPVPAPTAAPLTGINAFWTYEEKPIPGVGKAMVNVGTGNMVVQVDDVDIPERGIDLAFRRTYNSFSTHDSVNTDGSVQSNYGDGWTSTFDAHLGYVPTNGSNPAVMSVYDIDGARYDYVADGQGNWIPPAGQYATLTQNSNGCGYIWTKKSGTAYTFWKPVAACGSPAAYQGRLCEIAGRNHNNYIVLNYSWTDGVGNAGAEPTQISAAHSDGQSLTLTFTKQPNGHEELSQITRPDGALMSYKYNGTAGDLTEVDRPGNNAAPLLKEVYQYYAGGHLLQIAFNPRYELSGGTDGGYVGFAYDSSNRILTIAYCELVNFIPNDGTNTALQSGGNVPAAGSLNTYWYDESFSGWGTGQTNAADTQDHATSWITDAFGRVTQSAQWTGSISLVTNATWDTSNNLTSSTDARGNVTTYGYDASGNTLWVQEPSVTTSLGTGQPLSRYAYDSFNNLIAYCDAQYEWTTGAPTCAPGTGVTYYAYTPTAAEPFGELTATYTPMGYHHAIAYTTSLGDVGLPSTVTGDCMAQADGTQRCPQQTFTYNATGTLASYNKGNGAWTLTYDAMNRPLTHTDPDSVTSYSCYNPDGTVLYTESAYQHALDGGSGCQAAAPAYAIAFGYDADGNEISETHHYRQGPSVPNVFVGTETTQKFYDGEDRLVEVKQPQDSSSDAYTFAWMTRYLYDLSNNAAQEVDGNAISAHGNLFTTQECLPTSGTTATLSLAAYTSCSFQAVRGAAFDALDRTVNKYEVAFGTQPEQTMAYDANGSEGLLTQTTNSVGQWSLMQYDAVGRMTQKTYDNPAVTPSMFFTFDPDGRPVSSMSSLFGAQAVAYDADSRVTQVNEPTANANYTDPGIINYSYYGDGSRSALSLAIPAIAYNGTNVLQYNYRADGLMSSEKYTTGGTSGTYGWTYTNAGRKQTQSDPYTGMVPSMATTDPAFVPTTFTYDAYGEVANETLPSGYTITPSVRDAEGSATSEGFASAGARLSKSMALSTRNEMYSEQFPSTTNSAIPNPSYTGVTADGATCMYGCTVDTRSGQMLAGNADDAQQHAYAYDIAGRNTSNTVNCSYGTGFPNYQTVTATEVTARSYDAENHTLGETLTSTGGSNGCTVQTPPMGMTLQWGNSGHPYTVASGNTPTTCASNPTAGPCGSLHWDGADVLYTVQGPSNVILEIGKLGSVNLSNGLGGTNDRDESGQAVQGHASSCFSALSPTGSRLQAHYSFSNQKLSGAGVITLLPGCTQSGTQPATKAGDIVSSARNDGYQIGDLTIQGVRAFDSSLSTWTTPDAYAGNVHDPATQHRYMWNNNNPIAYEDPSGYETYCSGCQGLAPSRATVKQSPNQESYVKVEVTFGFGAIAFTHTSSGHDYFSGGAGAPEPSASLMVGTIIPNAGKTADDVVQGWSGGASAGAGLGIEEWGNSSGSASGAGLTTPWAGGSATFGKPIGSQAQNTRSSAKKSPKPQLQEKR